MALSTRHRSTIYERLAPILGDEETEAFLSELPMTRADELATKGDLALLKADLRTEMADLRTDLRTEMRDLQQTNTRWLVTTMLTVAAIQTAAIPILINLTS